METRKVEKRLIFKNLVYSISANLLSLLVSIILVLILPNLLGETAYGYLQLYLFYTTYVGFFHLGWIDGIYLRIGGKEYGQLEGQLYATQFIVLMIFELIVGVMIVVFANVFVPDVNRLHVIVLTCICMVIYIAKNYTTYILQATNRIKPYAIVTLIEKIIFAVIIIAAWVFRLGNYELIAIGDILGKLISTMVSLKYCKEILFCRLGNWKRTFQEIWINLSVGCKLLLANVAALLVNGIVRFAIERFWSIEVFGKVSLSMSLSNMLMVFISAISVVVFPMLKRMDEDKLGETYELIRNFLMIILLAALVFYYPAKHILTLFLPTYAESLKYMALMFPVCIFDSKISLLVNTYLKALRKEKKLTQVKLGEMLNYGYTAIANYESGRNQPSISDLKKIASIFNVSMDYLLGVNDIRYPYVIDDETAAFNEFRRYYTLLEEDSKADLLLYMEFLVERQNRMKAIPDLKYEDYELKNTIQKAAQKPVAYRKE